MLQAVAAPDAKKAAPAIPDAKKTAPDVPDAKKESPKPARLVNGQPYHLSVNLQGVRSSLDLQMVFVSEDDPESLSPVFDLKDCKHTAFRRDDPTAAGTQFQRMIELSEGFKPGNLSNYCTSL